MQDNTLRTAVFQNLATAEASHMIDMSNLTNQFAPITSAFHFPVARFWKTAVRSLRRPSAGNIQPAGCTPAISIDGA